MARFSQVEWNNGAGFLEELAIVAFQYQSSLFGAIPTVVFILANAQHNDPTIETGTHTAATSTTALIDTAADFIDANVIPGDLVVNTTDSDAVWEVTALTSQTVLAIRLLTSGGGDDDFDTGDAYRVERRNRLDVYTPRSTLIRVTGRELNKVFFSGRVMEAVSEDDRGERLRITVAGFDSELRDGQSLYNRSGSSLARSEIVRLGPTERHNGVVLGGAGEDIGMFVFPHMSFFEGREGIEHSMNLQTVTPDFQQANRSQLAEYLDMAKEDQWAPLVLREPTLPTISHATSDGEEELVSPSARGNLAQSFSPANHILVSKITCRLRRNGSITGNLYVRLEANAVSSDGSRNDIPSGELVAPWAESLLVNMANVTASPGDNDLAFGFDQPVALSAGSTYWLVLQYQEDNVTGYVATTDFIGWLDDSAGGFATGTQATYSGIVWTAVTGVDFRFGALDHTDAYWFYDKSGDSWEDQTTEVLTDNNVNGRFLDTLAGGVGAAGDRLYIRTAGPIKALDFQVEGAADAEYGTITARFFGSTRAKITGRHTAATSTTVLTDTDKDFRRLSIAVGDIVHNITDCSYGVITAIAQTTLTVVALRSGIDDDFDQGDLYEVVNLQLVTSGSATSGTTTVLTDTGASFITAGVREGDLVVNTTDNQVGVITAYGATTITTATGMAWDAADTYRVLSQWRVLTLKPTATTFQTGTSGAPVVTRLEWEIESDWEPTRFGAGFPEASDPGFTDVNDMAGFWTSIQASSQPATSAQVDLVTPIAGHGYSLVVSPKTHDDVILATGAHDGAASSANLIDVGVDFINGPTANLGGILVGDIVENITDGSTGTVTAVSTSVGATTVPNDTLEMALSGGGSNDWQVGEAYRITRPRQLLSYFRNGSRPLGGPSLEGLTFKQDGPESDQVWPLRTPQFSSSHRFGVNRVRVIGRTLAGVVITEVVNNITAQRDQGEIIVKTVTDYSLHSAAELIDRGNSELARLSYPALRGKIVAFRLPFHQRVARRLAWRAAGVFVASELDGAVFGAFVHSGGSGASTLQDAGINFDKWDVEVGDEVFNITDGSSAVVTGVSTTTRENDTVAGTLSGGTDDDWDTSDQYRIERRNYVKAGDLVRIKAEDPDFIDFDYLVVSVDYREPEFTCEIRLSRNFQSPSLEDPQTMNEFFDGLQDAAKMALQIAGTA